MAQRDSFNGRLLHHHAEDSSAVGPAHVPSPVAEHSRVLAFTSIAVGHYMPTSAAGSLYKALPRVLTPCWIPITYGLLFFDSEFFDWEFEWTLPAFIASAVLTLSFFKMADLEMSQESARMLQRELRDTPKNSLLRDSLLFGLLALFSVVQLCYVVTAKHAPAQLTIDVFGERAGRAFIYTLSGLWSVASTYWCLLINDLVLRLGWWMAAATASIVRFEETAVGEAAAVTASRVARSRAGNVPFQPLPPGQPPKVPNPMPVGEFTEEEGRMACDRLQQAFEDCEAIIHQMNEIFELSVSVLFAFAVSYAILAVRQASQAHNQWEAGVEATWAGLVFTCALGVAVWTSRVGDTWTHAKGRVGNPSTMLRLVRILRKERFEAFIGGMDRVHIGFEIAHVVMTTSMVVRLIFGLGFSVLVAVLHARHEEHREHTIAHEMVHGLQEIEAEHAHAAIAHAPSFSPFPAQNSSEWFAATHSEHR
jgi:hypothetical protein